MRAGCSRATRHSKESATYRLPVRTGGECSRRFAEGDAIGALALADSDSKHERRSGSAHRTSSSQQALDAALAVGDRAKAEELLAIVEEQPAGLRPPLLDATAHRFRARLAGDDPGADRQFTTSAAQFRALELPFFAVVQLEHGEWLMARGRPDDARRLVAEARETFERLRATPWLKRLDAFQVSAHAEITA